MYLAGTVYFNLLMYRTHPGSLLSTRLLLSSKTGPKSIVAFGAGAQIQAHLSLFLTAYPSIQTCTVFNRSLGPRLETLRGLIRTTFPTVRMTVGTLSHSDEVGSASLKEEVGKADIIITATSSTEPLFPFEYVRSGAHLCLIGSYKPEM